MALDASGVVATIGSGGLTVTVAHAATIPVTGLCTPGAESYAGQSISYLALADGRPRRTRSAAARAPRTPAAGPGDCGAARCGSAGGDGAAGTPDGGAINGGSTTNVGLASGPPMTAGCACGLAEGSPNVFVTVLCLLGCAISARRRSARRV